MFIIASCLDEIKSYVRGLHGSYESSFHYLHLLNRIESVMDPLGKYIDWDVKHPVAAWNENPTHLYERSTDGVPLIV